MLRENVGNKGEGEKKKIKRLKKIDQKRKRKKKEIIR